MGSYLRHPFRWSRESNMTEALLPLFVDGGGADKQRLYMLLILRLDCCIHHFISRHFPGPIWSENLPSFLPSAEITFHTFAKACPCCHTSTNTMAEDSEAIPTYVEPGREYWTIMPRRRDNSPAHDTSTGFPEKEWLTYYPPNTIILGVSPWSTPGFSRQEYREMLYPGGFFDRQGLLRDQPVLNVQLNNLDAGSVDCI